MKLAGRERIRRAAMGLFAEKGFTGTHTREICARAGVTKPVLYYHFKSKENLYRELLREGCGSMLRELALASYRGATARQKLTDVLAADFALTKRNPKLSAMLFGLVFAPQKEAPSVDYVQVGLDWLGLIEGILKEGVRHGELCCKPREVAVAFLGVDMIYSISHMVRGEPDLDRRLARRMVKLLLGGCARNSNHR
jgi:AcrR family transcriptional regulator